MDSILNLFKDFDLEKMIKGWLPGGWSSILSSFFGSFKNMFGGLVGTLFGGKIDEVQNSVAKVGDEAIIAKTNPELVAVRSGTTTNVTQFFGNHGTALGVPETVARNLEAQTQSVVTNFYASSIPEMKDGYPVDAYSTALDYRQQLVEYLLGSTEKKKLGALDVNKKDRKEIAERIATQITGVPKDADLNSLAANPPKFGLVAMLATTQADPKQDVVMLADASLTKASVQEVAALNKQDNKNIQGGTTVTKPAPPVVAAAQPHKTEAKPEKKVYTL